MAGRKNEDKDCMENYHSLFEQATDPILVTDFEGNFKDVNSSFCSLFGYSKEELLTKNVKELIQTDHLENKPIRFDLLAIGENIFNERLMVTKDNCTIIVESNAKKLSDNRILVITRDITARKQVEKELKKSEANLRTIFQNTDTVYVLLDTHFRIISYNKRALDFAVHELGYSFKTSEYITDYFHEEKRSGLLQHMQATLTGIPVHYEVSYPQQDGSFNWYHVRMYPIANDLKDVYGLMLALSDITENKLLQQQLLEQKVQEQKRIMRAVIKMQEIERNKLGQELHDNVNQILSATRLYLGLIDNEPCRRQEIIEKSKSFIDDAISEIRMLSRKQVTPQKSFDLCELITELSNDLNEHAGGATRFICNIPAGLLIEDDLKLNIYRIIQEQINNILRHAAAREASIVIRQDEAGVDILITDDGKGFDPQLKRKGIGISNVINRVESYNGKYQVDSQPGKGCTINVWFPN